jgi:membrane fusion protein (multidrug efflux system)
MVTQRIDEQAILVPQRAVSRDQKGEPTALVIGADNKVELRTLRTERTIGEAWLVTGGLKAGDNVIIEGLQKVAPGAPVKPVLVSGHSTTAAPLSAAAQE